MLIAGSNVIGVMPDNLGAGITASAETVTEVPEGYTPIYTVEDLYAIRANSSANYILMSDIDLSGTAEGGEWDGGNGWTPIPEFKGVLDGNGHTICNMHIFGDVRKPGFIEKLYGTIKNLHFDNVNINVTYKITSYYSGAIASEAYDCSIYDCSVSGKINVSTSSECYVGGIVGKLTGGTISTSYNNANIIVNSEVSPNYFIGGIVGYAAVSSIEDNYNSGNISYSGRDIRRGGIVGDMWRGNVSRCINFSDGKIFGTYAETSVFSCYYISESTFGYGGTELTPLLMKQQSSYLGLDFENIWEMHNERPRLRSNPEIFVTKMEFSKKPSTLSYYQGDELVVDGKLNVTFSDGSVKEVDITPTMVSGFDTNTIGVQEIEVTYKGFTITYPINVLPILVTEIVISEKDITVIKGKSYKLTASVSPENASDKTIVWSVDDETIATVDEFGTVTAHSAGKTTVTATASNGKKATCSVNVTIPATEITLDVTSAEMNVNENLTLNATVNPSDTTDKVKWRSDNVDVAVVDQNGKVTAKYPGVAMIYAETDSGLLASCLITINAPAKKIVLSDSNIKLFTNETADLSYTVYPEYTTDEITWTYDDNIIRIDSYGADTNKIIIYPQTKGTTTLTATTSSGVTASCTVEVDYHASYIYFEENYLQINRDESISVTPVFEPADATDTIKWESMDPNVATVDEDGVITGVGKGSTTIIATTTEGHTAELVVEVYVPVTEIELNEYELSLFVRETFDLVATLTPADTTDKLTWQSSDKGIVTVDSNGHVKAVGKGTAKVTVIATSGETATCSITVNIHPTSIELDKTSATLNVGKTFKLNCTLNPTDAVTDVTWYSENPEIATVDSKGSVKAVAPGSTKIYAETSNGLSCYCDITVTQPATDVVLDITEATLWKDEEISLTATMSPANTTDTLTWQSTDKNVATVDSNGLVKSVGKGTAVITVTSTSGKSATCNITVNVSPVSIELDTTSATLNIGETIQLNYTIDPSDATTEVTWYSENPEVATVDTAGSVEAVAPGNTKIYVETSNGLRGYCDITVTKPATDIVLDITEVTLLKDEEIVLTATLSPADTTDIIKWTSSDPSVATVDEYGKVVAINEGTATITAETTSGIIAVCKVTVNLPDLPLGLCGDVNGDGRVNSLDALLIMRSLTGSDPLSDESKILADVNFDNRVNSIDSLGILRYCAGYTDGSDVNKLIYSSDLVK